VDYALLASELLRALRGKRTQRAFSQRLGYRSNIAWRWESGRCFPTASQAFRIARTQRLDVAGCATRFLRSEGAQRIDLTKPGGVAAFLHQLRGARSHADIARSLGCSRFAVARWLKGTAEPKLPEFFALVEVLSLRLLELLAGLVGEERLPSLRDDMARRRAARDAAFERPWSHAVLRGLELASYCALPAHQPGFLAEKLGISVREEQACLGLLERSGQIERRAGRFVPRSVDSVDLRDEVVRLRALKSFWLDVAKAQLQAGSAGIFGFNLFAIAERDLAEVRFHYLEFYKQLQNVVARSSPSEQLMLFSAQLFRLDGG